MNDDDKGNATAPHPDPPPQGGREIRYVPEDSLKSPRFTGIPTFARLPNVRTTDDVDLAVVGVPFDTGVSFRPGGRFGPNAIRSASVLIRGHNPVLEVHPFRVLSCVDYGDVAIIPGYIGRSYEVIEREIAPLVEKGIVPLLLGGDHSVTLPHLRATRSIGPVAVVVFDAHTDAWDSFFGEKYNHGTWMRRAIEEGLVDVEHSIEVGLRGSVYAPEDWSILETELNLAYTPSHEILTRDLGATVELIRKRVAGRPTFISFDIDVVDPGFAPGTGTPEAGGLSSFQALQILRALRDIDFVGFDLVEVIPAYDPAGATATLAANIGFEMISLVALRRLQKQRGEVPVVSGATRR